MWRNEVPSQMLINLKNIFLKMGRARWPSAQYKSKMPMAGSCFLLKKALKLWNQVLVFIFHVTRGCTSWGIFRYFPGRFMKWTKWGRMVWWQLEWLTSLHVQGTLGTEDFKGINVCIIASHHTVAFRMQPYQQKMDQNLSIALSIRSLGIRQ